MPLKLGRVVGERVLTYGPKGRQRIIVRVGTPRKADPRTWQCAFQISGIRGSHVYAAYGVDALQALQLAFQGIRFYLARHRVRATWVGGEKGDPGFPQLVPIAFGLAFASRISRLIAREEKLYVREVLKRRREARRREPIGKKAGKK
jgi:Domain of unknown function (DUF6968)